ncbi:MAG: HAMP domain-containing histidine kinase [Clostridia bacterium]|nr:HAMP domain-containing histidine kinase [Clostridia bacterium]
MIKKLRKQFITISVIAVASVMMLLFAAVNVANFISANSKLNESLTMIAENGGHMPQAQREEQPRGEQNDPPEKRFGNGFNAETPYMTRFFVLHFDAEGNQINSDLSQIAAVTEADTANYITIALKHGEGDGFTSGYKYRITAQEDGSYMAIFVNDEREMSSALTLLWASFAATAVCIALITVLIVLFSKKAMEPVVQSNQKQKQFITDASHELKTPITVINTSLSVLEMEVGKQKWIDKAKAQCEKLKDLVNSLVTLSKLDEEENPLHFQSFAVSAAVEETVNSFADLAAEQAHSIEAEIAPDLHYCGDEYSVRQLCSILLDNALKYASEGTPIRFCLRKSRKGIVITAENACDNLDTGELDKLFDRFYRADKARSEKSGFGIGLSVARSICEAHKGSIRADSADGKVITFTAELN